MVGFVDIRIYLSKIQTLSFFNKRTGDEK